MKYVPSDESRADLVRQAREDDLVSTRLRKLRQSWSRAVRLGRNRNWAAWRQFQRIEVELARLARVSQA